MDALVVWLNTMTKNKWCELEKRLPQNEYDLLVYINEQNKLAAPSPFNLPGMEGLYNITVCKQMSSLHHRGIDTIDAYLKSTQSNLSDFEYLIQLEKTYRYWNELMKGPELRTSCVGFPESNITQECPSQLFSPDEDW